MDAEPIDCTTLCTEIDAYLHSCAATARGLDYWRGRPRLRTAEVALLTTLSHGPMPLERAAVLMGRDEPAARCLLEALTAIGLVERHDTLYGASAAARDYCRALVAGEL
ncbi:MAG TPA: hypothetical protein VFB58_18455 [Chloroflexota bacterium]|nr:hypothetical protein [Chloroflexota bacterium]